MNEPRDEYLDVVSRDGVRLRVRSRGPREAPAILFLHGFTQSHLSWSKQFSSELADEFHLIACDLRGHGWSEKPSDKAAYQESQRWGDDVDAVLRALDVRRAILVGWSYGGRVILDYLATHATAAVAGINFVAAVIGSEDEYYGEEIGKIRATYARDPATSLDGARAFLRACFAAEPERDEFERMLAYNAMVPPEIRAKLGGRRVDARELLAGLRVPVLFTHGSQDRIIALAMSRYGTATVPGSTLSIYDGIGHSPFYESAARFNHELRDFARACYAGNTRA